MFLPRTYFLISIIVLSIIVLLCSPSVHAAVTDHEFAELKSDLMALMQRVHSLEAENVALRATSDKVSEIVEKQAIASTQSSWADDLKWKGDFRYRYEGIRVEDQSNRDRNRIRGRIAMIATLPQNVEVGFGMATGGDDPVSTNQTLGGGGSTKDVRLDLAYFNWSATERIDVIGGKFKNIWIRAGKNGLVWDSDFNPEGFAMTYDDGKFFVNGSLDWLESDSKRDNVRFLWGLQGGLNANIGDNRLRFGMSYFDIPVKGRSVFHGDETDFAGNSFACADPTNLLDCTYQNNYEEVEVFAELASHLGEMPVAFFADYARNLDADQFDTAWAAGVKLGKSSRSGSWDVTYRYQDLEADALFGLTVDSDFGGGGTDAKGHIFKSSYALNKKWKVAFTYFVNKRNGNLGVEEDYKRVQIDTKFKF